jgi:hypothetical protein
MTNKRISELDDASTLDGTELMELVQDSSNRKMALSNLLTVPFAVAVGDEGTALTAGTAKVSFQWPCDGVVVGVFAGLNTAQTSGDILTVDVHNDGSTMLSTKLTIDNGERSSLTAETPPVLTNAAITKGDWAAVDIAQVESGSPADAAGLKLYFDILRTP